MESRSYLRHLGLLTAGLLWTACGNHNEATGSHGSSGCTSSVAGATSGGSSSSAGAAGSGGTGTAGAAGSTGNDVAPALDRTGPNATQLGVQDGAINARRMVVVRGRVLDGSAAPVAQAVVASPEHPEYGHTLTRTDGTFDIVVNGGGAVRLNVAATGYLGVERELRPEWRSFEPLTDIFLTKLDGKVTEVTLGESATQQLAQGSAASDRSGARTGSLVFGAGTTANLLLPDGSKQPLPTAHVRITEYTVGDNGPKAMPAQLPPQSGYTYAVELSVDEATAAGATGVEFSKPVPYYVDNFLNFPVGEPVPAGYYDRAQGQWVPAPSGRVIAILDVQNGSAMLDVDGDGAADDQTRLTALGITDEELATLGTSYAKGKSLWRVPVSHFSTWDFNWCFFGRLFDALASLAPNHDALDDDCVASGSLIECQNQILGESLKLTGLPSSLNYRSDRVPGRREAYQLDVQLTGQAAPPEAKRVRFELEILGQHITYNTDAAANLAYHYVWDGKDGYGRIWQGPAPIRYRVGYVYDGWYGHTEVFGDYGQLDTTRWTSAPDSGAAQGAGVTPEDDLPRHETTMWLSWQKATVGAFDSSQLGFGGFTLSEHHTYDPESRTLYLGTGDRRHAGSNRDVVRPLIGAVEGTGDESGDPRHTELDGPHGLVVSPDGTIYLAVEDQNRVLKLGLDNTIQVVAGTGSSGYSGDGGPATQAELSLPLGLALGKDGSLYICERGNSVVRRVNPSGIIETVAGSGAWSSSNGDGGSATQARIGEPHSVTVSLDGSLFIVDATDNNVRRVRPDGVIETVLGSSKGLSGSTGDGGPGTQALLNSPLGIVVGRDGSLYVSEHTMETAFGAWRRMAPHRPWLALVRQATPGMVVLPRKLNSRVPTVWT